MHIIWASAFGDFSVGTLGMYNFGYVLGIFLHVTLMA